MLGMELEASELLAGESVLFSKPVNAVIRLSEYGLKRLPYDQLMNVMGFAGKEAIGGKLHLTTVRLVFKAHPLNRVQGKFSIFLPVITSLRNTSKFVMKRMEVGTELQTFEFIVWGVDDLISRIDAQKGALTSAQKLALQKAVAAHPAQFISDAHVSKIMNNAAMNLPEIGKKIAEILTNPLDLSAAINVLEITKMIFAEEGK